MLLADQYGNSQIYELTTFSDWDIYKTGIDVFNEIEVFRSPLLMERVVEKLGINTSYTSKNAIGRVSELYNETPLIVKFIEPIKSYNGEEISSISFELETEDGKTCKIKDIRLNGIKLSGIHEVNTGEVATTPMGKIKISQTEHFSTDKTTTIAVSHNTVEGVANGLCKSLSTKLSDKKSTVIDLSITDSNPKRAEDILNTLLEVYNEEWIRYMKESSDNTSKFIDEQLSKIEKDLGLSNSNIEYFLADKKNSTSASKLNIYNKLSTARLLKESIDDNSIKQELLPDNIGIESDSIKKLITEYNKIILSRKGSTFSDKDNSQLMIIKQTILHSLNNLINTLSTQAKKIADDESDIASQISSNPSKAKDLLSIEREQKIKEELYLYLLQKREENELTASIAIHNTRLLKPAMGDAEPISPKKRYIILLALIFGMTIPYAYRYLSCIYTSTLHKYHNINNSKN